MNKQSTPVMSLPERPDAHQLMKAVRQLIENHPNGSDFIDLFGERLACRSACNDLFYLMRDLAVANEQSHQYTGGSIEKFEDHIICITTWYKLFAGIEKGFELTGQAPIFDPSAGIISESGEDYRPFKEVLPKSVR